MTFWWSEWIKVNQLYNHIKRHSWAETIDCLLPQSRHYIVAANINRLQIKQTIMPRNKWSPILTSWSTCLPSFQTASSFSCPTIVISLNGLDIRQNRATKLDISNDIPPSESSFFIDRNRAISYYLTVTTDPCTWLTCCKKKCYNNKKYNDLKRILDQKEHMFFLRPGFCIPHAY